MLQDAAEKGADEPVAGVRPAGNPAVHERGLHACTMAGAQQVGPDLGLHHDEEPWPDQPQRPLDDEAEVERKVEHLIDVLQVLRGDLLARHGGRRQEDPEPGVPLAQLGQQGAGGQDFSDRHRVNPDGAVAVKVERHRQIAHALFQARDVLAIPHGLVQQVGRHDDEERHGEGGVGDVHGGNQG